MKIRSALFTDASGSIGGFTASKNKGGQYFRARVKGAQPNSPAQTQVRATMTGISQAWRTISEADRDAWKAAAQAAPYQNALGETKTLTGQMLFNKMNGNARAVDPSNPLINTPITPPSMALTLNSISVENDGGVAVFGINATALWLGNQSVSAFAVMNVSAGLGSPKRSAFKKLATVNTASNDFEPLKDALNDLEITPITGRKAFMFLEVVDLVSGAKTVSNVAFFQIVEA